MTVLSIQSRVVYGHVGNSIAVPALQRLAIGAWPLDTVVLSNHPAHGGYRGRPVPAANLRDLLQGLAERGLLARPAAVLSGYLGLAETGWVVSEAVDAVRAAHPGALYCCDPVMGDRPTGLFVQADIPAVFRDRLVPLADLATPNAFELEQLTGQPVTGRVEAVRAARLLLGRGQRLVVVTGIGSGTAIETLAVTHAAVWSVTVPRINVPSNGAGDLFTAVFLGRYLEKADPARALGLAASTVQAVLLATEAEAGDELALLAALDAVLAPPRLVAVTKVA
ncbi:MAG: pyridoxal kinase [Alphaproteobacteria bacterium]|nr:pyridoxal kinase [Alphaproteobacteria bacterium]